MNGVNSNTVTASTISLNGQDGLSINNAVGNVFSGLQVTDNTWYGIRTDTASNNNQFLNNTVTGSLINIDINDRSGNTFAELLNTWTGNVCNNDNPDGICADPPPPAASPISRWSGRDWQPDGKP
jgi:hypothetical protein